MSRGPEAIRKSRDGRSDQAQQTWQARRWHSTRNCQDVTVSQWEERSRPRMNNGPAGRRAKKTPLGRRGIYGLLLLSRIRLLLQRRGCCGYCCCCTPLASTSSTCSSSCCSASSGFDVCSRCRMLPPPAVTFFCAQEIRCNHHANSMKFVVHQGVMILLFCCFQIGGAKL